MPPKAKKSSKSNISEHLKNIFEDKELDKEVVVRKFRTTTQHGAIEGKTQTHEVLHYNLDVIIALGYRVQSPLTVVDGCTVPRLEKIMVDIIGDNELFFASGSETYNIYEFACDRNRVNKSKLLRYASRRNRKAKVEQILRTIENDKSQE